VTREAVVTRFRLGSRPRLLPLPALLPGLPFLLAELPASAILLAHGLRSFLHFLIGEASGASLALTLTTRVCGFWRGSKPGYTRFWYHAILLGGGGRPSPDPATRPRRVSPGAPAATGTGPTPAIAGEGGSASLSSAPDGRRAPSAPFLRLSSPPKVLPEWRHF
jgi:hypothetical protein